MKTAGLLGGMSWESTVSYYKGLNEGVRNRLGGLHSAKLLLNSMEFAELESCMCCGDWQTIEHRLCAGAKALEAGGADFLMLCTNTMHKLAPQIESAVSIPFLHIADATGEKAKSMGLNKVGLLGTAFTMQQDFYKARIQDNFGIDVCIPDESDIPAVHEIIFNELCCGVINNTSRGIYVDIINTLTEQGAEAVILGCTEIALLVQPEHVSVPLLDTTAIHVEAALNYMLEE